MKLPLLRIDLSRIAKIEFDMLRGGESTPVGQLFAFESGPLLEAAKAMTSRDLDVFQVLQRTAIEGLWKMRTKHPALVGFLPDSESTPVIRLFLMSQRDLSFSKFTEVVARFPGYMESGRGHIQLQNAEFLAYWEYPCSAYAIWSASPEGVPFLDSEAESFESSKVKYWMIHREFEFCNGVE